METEEVPKITLLGKKDRDKEIRAPTDRLMAQLILKLGNSLISIKQFRDRIEMKHFCLRFFPFLLS